MVGRPGWKVLYPEGHRWARVTVGIAACIVSHSPKRDSDPCTKEVSWL